MSGLAARRTDSARIMVPGFLALGASSLIMDHPDAAVRRLLRLAGVGTITAGIFRCSTPECPDPLSDPDATDEDLAHSVASIGTFLTWVALPAVAARNSPPGPYRELSRAMSVAAALGLIGAATTTRADSPLKGVAQRAFLGTAFAWHGATAVLAPTA